MVTYIDTKSVEIELRDHGLPQFLNAIIAHHAKSQELYLCQDMGQLKANEQDMKKLKNEQLKPLKVCPNGALGNGS